MPQFSSYILFSSESMRQSSLDDFFFFNDTATTEIYTLSLPDALPIYLRHFEPSLPGSEHQYNYPVRRTHRRSERTGLHASRLKREGLSVRSDGECAGRDNRSEEHTSELQSHLNLVCRLLLEKKKNRLY